MVFLCCGVVSDTILTDYRLVVRFFFDYFCGVWSACARAPTFVIGRTRTGQGLRPAPFGLVVQTFNDPPIGGLDDACGRMKLRMDIVLCIGPVVEWTLV